MRFYARKQATKSGGFCPEVHKRASTHNTMGMISKNVVLVRIEFLGPNQLCWKVVPEKIPGLKFPECFRSSATATWNPKVKSVRPEEVDENKWEKRCRKEIQCEQCPQRVSQKEQHRHDRNHSELNCLVKVSQTGGKTHWKPLQFRHRDCKTGCSWKWQTRVANFLKRSGLTSQSLGELIFKHNITKSNLCYLIRTLVSHWHCHNICTKIHKNNRLLRACASKGPA